MTEPPGDPIGGFPEPPRSVVDDKGREIFFRQFNPNATDELVKLYLGFAPADRAQGIPPASEAGIRSWLDTITGAERLNLVARCDGAPVGHATLVPDEQKTLSSRFSSVSPTRTLALGQHSCEQRSGRPNRPGWIGSG